MNVARAALKVLTHLLFPISLACLLWCFKRQFPNLEAVALAECGTSGSEAHPASKAKGSVLVCCGAETVRLMQPGSCYSQ